MERTTEHEQLVIKYLERITAALEKITNDPRTMGRGFKSPVLTKAANKIKHI